MRPGGDLLLELVGRSFSTDFLSWLHTGSAKERTEDGDNALRVQVFLCCLQYTCGEIFVIGSGVSSQLWKRGSALICW